MNHPILNELVQKQRADVKTIGNYQKMSLDDIKRFHTRCPCNIFGTDCVVWEHAVSNNNVKGGQHPRFCINGKNILLTRLLYLNYCGDIPDDAPWVLHKCDTNGRCINLNHLYLGTPKQNSADCKAHGNSAGTFSGKLTKDQVLQIKKEVSTPSMDKIIAQKFQVNYMTISRIRRGLIWKDV